MHRSVADVAKEASHRSVAEEEKIENKYKKAKILLGVSTADRELTHTQSSNASEQRGVQIMYVCS